MGVDLFFVLSGFLITGRLLENKGRSIRGYFGHFYARRARRILPPYLLLLLITVLVFGTWWLRSWYICLFLTNFAVVVGAQLPESLCILWSLGVEEQFYLAWPFAVYFLGEVTIAWLAASLIFVAPLLRWFCTPLFPSVWFIYTLTPFRMDTLAAGALIAIIWRRRQYWIKQFGHFGPILSLVAAGVLGLLAKNSRFTTSANTRESNTFIYELTLIIVTGIVLWALSGRAVRILTFAPVRYLGRISYTVYLVHLTVFALVARYVRGTTETVLATLFITLLFASASWFLLERPILGRPENKVISSIRPIPPVDELEQQTIQLKGARFTSLP
ncbi:acyltransferase [Edaphobacter acidisoli]|uniref:Acyltransferase n=2 Tax=Edaphobacter acidisoli TaxID=2040573 RepID=A0A916RV79_9BACT|nr:acyltransferase [Edaphobacter acidisoli]